MWVAVELKLTSQELLSCHKQNQGLLGRACWAFKSSRPGFRSQLRDLLVAGPWAIVFNLSKPLVLHLNMGITPLNMSGGYEK